MEVCSHGYRSPLSCVDCMNDGNVAPPTRQAPVTVEATFPARFDGDCPECHLTIHEGQTIARLSTERYVHERCIS